MAPKAIDQHYSASKGETFTRWEGDPFEILSEWLAATPDAVLVWQADTPDVVELP